MTLQDYLKERPYPGRGIAVGKTKDASHVIAVYFIMGRSANSQNRIFRKVDDNVMIYPYDESKVEDPSLIIYAPMRRVGNRIILTNGDQTDTVYEGLSAGKSFEESLATRCFEPDPPIFTPRISSLISICEGETLLRMSILKSADAQGSVCERLFFSPELAPGRFQFISTYAGDGNPVNTFRGTPVSLAMTDEEPEQLIGQLWSSLNESYRVSMLLLDKDLRTGEEKCFIINKFLPQEDLT